MNMREAFKQLRDAVEWLFDELDINNRENQLTLDELREELLKLAPTDSTEQLARYTVIRMVGKIFGGCDFISNTGDPIESALMNIFMVFGGDGPDEGMFLMTNDEYSDKSDITLSMHLESLNLITRDFEKEYRRNVRFKSDLWGPLANIVRINHPELSVWITAVKRMLELPKAFGGFNELESNNDLTFNNKLQDIFSVYRTIRPFGEVK